MEIPSRIENSMKLCFVNEELNLVFINIPKNSSTAIRGSIPLIIEEYNDSHKYYIKFLVIRNPFDRIISSYFEVIKLRRDTGNTSEITKNKTFYLNKNPIELSFYSFVKDLYINGFYEDHTFPQIEYLRKKGINIEDNTLNILLFENIHPDFANFTGKILGKSIELQNVHYMISSKKKAATLKTAIKCFPALYSMISEIYKEDIEMYKYFKKLKNRM